ncbi:hypothetical protein A6A27_31490 [Micromonospora sp. CB01531]|nr:hypothetical protein A6A27_31490 [Micromonospora sp. CB01531]
MVCQIGGNLGDRRSRAVRQLPQPDRLRVADRPASSVETVTCLSRATTARQAQRGIAPSAIRSSVIVARRGG